MADEFIRLDTTIIGIDNLINEAATGTMARTLFKAKDVIYSQQRYTTDGQPVKRGKWEMFWQNGRPKLKCTNCHTLFDIRTNNKHICIYPKFCEECGADMRNKED